MRDLFNHVHPLTAVAPGAAVADDTAFVSGWIDRKNFESLTFLLVTGTNADANATHTVLIEDADASDKSDAAAVADANLLGTEALAAYTFADDGETRKIGYVGNKRYARITVTPVGNTGNAYLGVIALLGHPSSGPTINPPV